MIEFIFFILLAVALLYMEKKDKREGRDRWKK